MKKCLFSQVLRGFLGTIMLYLQDIYENGTILQIKLKL